MHNRKHHSPRHGASRGHLPRSAFCVGVVRGRPSAFVTVRASLSEWLGATQSGVTAPRPGCCPSPLGGTVNQGVCRRHSKTGRFRRPATARCCIPDLGDRPDRPDESRGAPAVAAHEAVARVFTKAGLGHPSGWSTRPANPWLPDTFEGLARRSGRTARLAPQACGCHARDPLTTLPHGSNPRGQRDG